MEKLRLLELAGIITEAKYDAPDAIVELRYSDGAVRLIRLRKRAIQQLQELSRKFNNPRYLEDEEYEKLMEKIFSITDAPSIEPELIFDVGTASFVDD